MAMVSLKTEDYVFGGFWSDKFPLANSVQTMAVLHQRALTGKYVGKDDLRARVYYNLVVLFRLLWHHRVLEPTVDFWEYIAEDFPAKGIRPKDIMNVVLHYISARIAYLSRPDEKKRTESFLSQLVDQWRSIPRTEKDATGKFQHSQTAYFDSRRARESWNAVLRLNESKLIHSKQLNWPNLSFSSADMIDRLASSLSNSETSPRPRPGQKDGVKQPSNPTGLPTLADPSVGYKPSVAVPPTTRGEDARALRLRLISLPVGTRNTEPGRLTPPVELQLLRQRTAASDATGRPLAAGQGNVSASLTSKVNSSMPKTPSKRPASRSDGLSPCSKRPRTGCERSDEAGDRNLVSAQLQRGEVTREPAPLVELSPHSKRLLSERAQLDSATELDLATAKTSTQPQRIGCTKDRGTIVLQPSTEPQSLEEMIASAARSASAADGSGAKAPSSSDLIADSSGRATEARVVEAQVAEARDNRLSSPTVIGREAPMILIDVPATIFELARRIEDLEMKAAEGQADVQATISRLACRVAKLENKFDHRENVSKNVAAGVSALTCTISGLERTLGGAVDAQATAAALTSRITDLERTIDKKVDAQDRRITDIQNTVEARSEARGIKEAGEIIE